ncbi:MAG TPA: hypothetical protein PKY38_13165 [Opitutaceae bacterium]|nr:hypothetical protein [Opitutaceae bacterium]
MHFSRRRIVFIHCLALAAVAWASAPAGPSAGITLTNAEVEIGIQPAHGLILGFGRRSQENLLWVNPHPLSSARHSEWINYGGDKLWWGPFVDWLKVKGRYFPPDEVLDEPWEVKIHEPARVVMRSGVSRWTGSRAEREIILEDGAAGVVIHNRFIRHDNNPQRLQLWTVSQIQPPLWVWLDRRPNPGEPGFVNLRPGLWDPAPHVRDEPELGCVRGLPSPEGNYMIGTRGAWLAAVYEKFILVQQVDPYPEGDYPENVSLQLFSDGAYVELETLGGVANPGPGETMQNTVRWRLLDRPPGLDDDALNRWLRAQLPLGDLPGSG